jgi:hypothetical protein
MRDRQCLMPSGALLMDVSTFTAAVFSLWIVKERLWKRLAGICTRAGCARS